MTASTRIARSYEAREMGFGHAAASFDTTCRVPAPRRAAAPAALCNEQLDAVLEDRRLATVAAWRRDLRVVASCGTWRPNADRVRVTRNYREARPDVRARTPTSTATTGTRGTSGDGRRTGCAATPGAPQFNNDVRDTSRNSPCRRFGELPNAVLVLSVDLRRQQAVGAK
jgi:hypothetical protein